MTDSKQSTEQRVLLVDHLDETSRNTAFLLCLAGYEVTTARGLDEAINIVSVFCPGEKSPDIILIDNLDFTSKPNGMVDLLANRCKSSRIILINRAKQQNSQREAEYRVIAPRHLLGGLRKAFTEHDMTSELLSLSCTRMTTDET